MAAYISTLDMTEDDEDSGMRLRGRLIFRELRGSCECNSGLNVCRDFEDHDKPKIVGDIQSAARKGDINLDVKICKSLVDKTGKLLTERGSSENKMKRQRGRDEGRPMPCLCEKQMDVGEHARCYMNPHLDHNPPASFQQLAGCCSSNVSSNLMCVLVPACVPLGELPGGFDCCPQCTMSSPPRGTTTPQLCSVESSPLCSMETPPLCSMKYPPLYSMETPPLCSMKYPPLCSMETPPLCSMKSPPLCSMETPPLCSMKSPPLCSMETPPFCSMKYPPLCSMETHPLCSMQSSSLCTMETLPLCSMAPLPPCSFRKTKKHLERRKETLELKNKSRKRRESTLEPTRKNEHQSIGTQTTPENLVTVKLGLDASVQAAPGTLDAETQAEEISTAASPETTPSRPLSPSGEEPRKRTSTRLRTTTTRSVRVLPSKPSLSKLAHDERISRSKQSRRSPRQRSSTPPRSKPSTSASSVHRKI